MTFFFMTLAILLFIAFSVIIFSLKNGISPMPSSQRVRKALFNTFPKLEKGVVADLGSGWGHLVFPLATQYTTSKVVGFENSWIPFWFSYFLNGYSNLKIVKKNFFQQSLNDFDVIVCYLFPKGMEKLSKKLEKELKPGALVISHTFALPGWKPFKTLDVDDLYYTKIYFYQKKGKIDEGVKV